MKFTIPLIALLIIATTTKAQNNIQQTENEVLEQINSYRKSKGLGILKVDENIRREAYGHSQNMAQGKIPFSHKGFDERFERLGGFLEISSGAENVANGPLNAKNIVDGWIASTGHRKNIEGDFNLTGIGIALAPNGTYFYTQIFVLSKERPRIIISEFEQELLRLINEHRKTLGIPALRSNDKIASEARNYSNQMAQGKVPIGAPGFDNPIRKIVNVFNASSMSEVIAYDYYSPKEVFDSWMSSANQRETIEGSYNLTGIGVVQSADGKVFVTQLFLSASN